MADMRSVHRTCPYCGSRFLPSRYHPQQRVCSEADCQRRRHRDYRRRKLKSDPEYLQTCRDSQQQWRQEHPDYPRQYRQEHPQYTEKNREAQRQRDQRRRLSHLVKNTLAFSQVYIFPKDRQRSALPD